MLSFEFRSTYGVEDSEDLTEKRTVGQNMKEKYPILQKVRKMISPKSKR